MKRIFTITSLLFLLGTISYAQSEIDALNMSRNDLTGTARGISMGGAFGALGGDITGVAINPAGIGVYKSSEIVATMNFRNNKTDGNYNHGKSGSTRFQFAFDNFGLVGTFPIYNDVAPFINVGFSYNKIKNFDRKYQMKGVGLASSATDFIAKRATYSPPNLSVPDPYATGADWLGVLAAEAGLIGELSNGSYESVFNKGKVIDNDLWVREKGYINSYDFNIGTTFADIVSFGVSVAITDLNYKSFSVYGEGSEHGNSFDLINGLETEGSGYQIKAGVIFKPINELRIGVAYHSPTWYEMSDYYYGSIYTDINNNNNFALAATTLGKYGEWTRSDYDFKTPDKWVFSLAGVIGKYAIISMDYELTNYKNNMKFRNLSPMDDPLQEQNSFIKQDFRNASTLRVGAEVRFTPQISGRVGYAWMQSPYNSNLDNEAVGTAGTIPHYTVQGDTHHFTYGLGYKFTPNIYADIAFVMKTQKDDLYSFSRFYENGDLTVDSRPGELKNNIFSGLLTLGFKF